jgi:hypothetical protein
MLGFQVSAYGQLSPIYMGSLVAYAPPGVSMISGAPSQLDTRGGGRFNFSGSFLGPVGTPALVTYSANFSDLRFPVYAAAGCTVVLADSLVGCAAAAAGVGAFFAVTVSVGGQSSGPSDYGALSYRQPVVSSLSGLGVAAGPTTGVCKGVFGGHAYDFPESLAPTM